VPATASQLVTLYNYDAEQINIVTSVLTWCRCLFLCSFLYKNHRLLTSQFHHNQC